MRRVAAVALTALLLTGCSSSPIPEPAPETTTASPTGRDVCPNDLSVSDCTARITNVATAAYDAYPGNPSAEQTAGYDELNTQSGVWARNCRDKPGRVGDSISLNNECFTALNLIVVNALKIDPNLLD